MDRFGIDSHKLIYHVARVNDWLQGKDIFPVYMEISPSGACNHRCTYCAFDFMKYRPRFLDKGILKKRLREMGRLGVKSVMYAGEGEPFLHKDIAEIISSTKAAGIDAAVTTNGVLFGRKLADAVLGDLTWLKASINAGTKETYFRIHRTDPKDFDEVFANMAYAAGVKRARTLKCALGMQLVLLPENRGETELLAKKARDIGMDYLAIKPYSQHPLSGTKKYRDIKYSGDLRLAEKLAKLNAGGFSVIFRANAMRKWDNGERTYEHCLALPFWAHLDSDGTVWGCSMFLQNDKFRYGNINRQTFRRIFSGTRRRQCLEYAQKMDAADCRINCRMDEINRYLWRLKNPVEHVNFI